MVERFAYKLPLVFEPQPEGGYTVTSPILPELVTEGDTISEALANVEDALIAIIEAYEDLGRPLPPDPHSSDPKGFGKPLGSFQEGISSPVGSAPSRLANWD
jgi:antitoxin HicB